MSTPQDEVASCMDVIVHLPSSACWRDDLPHSTISRIIIRFPHAHIGINMPKRAESDGTAGGMTTENRIRHCGMLNLGNTGYIEVVLHTIYHCTEFRELILSLDLNGEPRDDPSTYTMMQELQRLFEEWQMIENVLPCAEDPKRLVQQEVLQVVYSHINPFIGPIGAIDPTQFIHAVQKCIKLRHAVDQPNDAHQFYSTFIRKLHLFFQMETNIPKSARTTFQRLFVTLQSKSKQCLRCSAVLPNSGELLKVGSLAYCFDCPVASMAGHQHQHSENDHQEQPSHLTPRLIKALREGNLQFGVSSQNRCVCSPNQSVSARITIQPVYAHLPNLLVVRLKRWPASNRNVYLEFDEFIDVTELLVQHQQPSPLVYRLLSVVVHHGNIEGHGRYFSYIRCNDGLQWGRFWGTNVKPVDWATVQRESFGGHNDGQPSKELSNVGYMLYYEKVDPQSPK